MHAINKMMWIAISSYKENYLHLREKYKVISFVGLIGFPLYYYVWKYLFPQPYENIPLRVIGVLFSIFVLVQDLLPVAARRLGPLLTYVFAVYAMPFFFTFMMLKNGVNIVWQLSMTASIAYLVLLMDVINVVICFLLGCGLAVVVYIATENSPNFPAELFAALPVFLFVMAGGVLFNHSEERIRRENKLRALSAVGSSIAHEMRTPLLGITYDSESCRRDVRTLLEAHDWAVKNGWTGRALSETRQRGLTRALDRIGRHTAFANTMIDMLLMNVREESINPSGFAPCSMATVVEQALDAYPFKGDARKLVHWERNGDFTFSGSDVLMHHALFNLLKNALRAIADSGRGHISIRLEPGEEANRLVFRDTGPGIPQDQIPHLFEPFWSGRQDGTRVGIGLAFVRRVIGSFGGTIVCQSEYGSFTEFTIILPCLRNKTNENT